MIYEQPVCFELARIKAKTLLIIGQADRTVDGKPRVKKDILLSVGQYSERGRRGARVIPHSSLLEVDNVGHVPHLEAPERFHREVYFS
jgi:pimeloyl-ACP methyl ester carboxylesterase